MKIPTIPLLESKIRNLEKCISDFKEYDAKRTERINKLKEEIRELEKKCSDLTHSIDILYSSIDEAKPSISNPKVKAVYFQMIEKLKKEQKENKELKEQINHYILSGRCDPMILKINDDLRTQNERQKDSINSLKKAINKLKIENES